MELQDIKTMTFGGYSKEDVREYISEILEENEKLLELEHGRAEELEAQNSRLLEELHVLRTAGERQEQNKKYHFQEVEQLRAKTEAECLQMRQEATENVSWQIRTAAVRLEQTERECREKVEEAEKRARQVRKATEQYLQKFSKEVAEALKWLELIKTEMDQILPQQQFMPKEEMEYDRPLSRMHHI